MNTEQRIVAIKQIRQDGDKVIQALKDLPLSRETNLAITKFQEGVMWCGMILKAINDAGEASMPNPYPSSKDPSTGSKIEPTADNLKL